MWSNSLLYEKEFGWPVPLFPGWELLNCWNFLSNRSVFVVHGGSPLGPIWVYANEVNYCGLLDSPRKDAGCAEKTNLLGGEESWTGFSNGVNHSINHAYIRKFQQKSDHLTLKSFPNKWVMCLENMQVSHLGPSQTSPCTSLHLVPHLYPVYKTIINHKYSPFLSSVRWSSKL